VSFFETMLSRPMAGVAAFGRRRALSAYDRGEVRLEGINLGRQLDRWSGICCTGVTGRRHGYARYYMNEPSRPLRSELISMPTVRRNGAARRKRFDKERAPFGHALDLLTPSLHVLGLFPECMGPRRRAANRPPTAQPFDC
jgi:hypothetical protein